MKLHQPVVLKYHDYRLLGRIWGVSNEPIYEFRTPFGTAFEAGWAHLEDLEGDEWVKLHELEKQAISVGKFYSTLELGGDDGQCNGSECMCL